MTHIDGEDITQSDMSTIATLLTKRSGKSKSLKIRRATDSPQASPDIQITSEDNNFKVVKGKHKWSSSSLLLQEAVIDMSDGGSLGLAIFWDQTSFCFICFAVGLILVRDPDTGMGAIVRSITPGGKVGHVKF